MTVEKKERRTMAKPIFIVTSQFDPEEIDRFQRSLQAAMPDYHILVAYGNTEELTFEAFYPSDFTDIDMEELIRKAKLTQSINKEEVDAST